MRVGMVGGRRFWLGELGVAEWTEWFWFLWRFPGDFFEGFSSVLVRIFTSCHIMWYEIDKPT